MTSLVKNGTCHVFGDGIPLDEGLMPFKYAIERVTDPARLIPHLFESIDPGFAARVRPGDIVVAGSDFANGKPHVQGFIAMVALGMSVVCVSMPYKILRRAVAKGLPVITGAPPPAEIADAGDALEVDYASGVVTNTTRGTATACPPMAPILLEIVERGGMDALLKNWLVAHPEQAKSESQALRATPSAVPVTVVKRLAV